MAAESKENKVFLIFVNKKELKVQEEVLTGQQILTAAGYDPSQYSLYLIRGQKSDPIQPGEPVKMENGLHFNAILSNAQYGWKFDS
ncbi:MAG TPA: multiubiquitin domain-containing protein [Candidatus Bathyarchaeia archaeon]|nr:multiubiquitin domain-containing protein [Candidatus Bathyarchaeia archaeon]